MAVLLKIEGYLVMPDRKAWQVDSDEIATFTEEILGGKLDAIGKGFSVQTVSVPDWNDNHRLNYINTTKTEIDDIWNDLRSKSQQRNEVSV